MKKLLVVAFLALACASSHLGCTSAQLAVIAKEHSNELVRDTAADELRYRRIHAQITMLLPAVRSARARIEDPRKAKNVEIHMPAGECHALLLLAELALRAWKITL